MKMVQLLVSLMFGLMVLAGCSSSEEGGGSEDEMMQKEVKIMVSAAASLMDALNEIKTLFEERNTHIEMIFNFGSSGTLQRQISQGAPVDLFFSAAKDQFDQLVEEKLIDSENQVDVVGNQLVLVTSNDRNLGIQSFEDLKKAKTISIGTPTAVPAGRYAQEVLEEIGILNEIQDKLVFAKDVRQVLTYVETGNVDAGIVYRTDAMISSSVDQVATAEEHTHSPIVYPLGLVNGSQYPEEAGQVYHYLQTEEALSILEKHGFTNLLK